LRKAILRRLVLVRKLVSTEWTLRLRGTTVAWRRGITRDYWVSLLLWWPTNRLEYGTNVESLSIKDFQESKMEIDEETRKPTEHAVPAEGERLAGMQLLLDTVRNLAVGLVVVHIDKAAVDRRMAGRIEVGR
jgi:hypothetical protein